MSFAICTVAVAPLRKEPDHRSEMTSQLLFGEAMQVVEEKGEWIQIRCLYDNYEGWLTYHLITMVPEAIALVNNNFVTPSLVNAMTCNGVIFQIPMGCSLPGYNEKTKQLWTADFSYDGALRHSKPPFTTQLFQNTIRPWLHAPYLWGGKTFLGVDCSGFVQTVFKVLGVALWRDAWQQATQGSAIELENAREGDVAFFHNEAGKIIHVGLVLAENKIIHAAGKVRIDTLTNKGIFRTADGMQTHSFHSVKRMADLVL